MKRIVLLATIILAGIYTANAWSRVYDKAALLLASKNYTPKTRELVVRYVHEDFTKPSGHLAWHRKNGRLLHTEGWHRLHLDSNLQPIAKDENDAYVQIEKALEIVRNRKKYDKAEVSLAIQTVMNLVLDMHNIANVTLENHPKSYSDFDVLTSKGTANGRSAKITPYSWRTLWTHRYLTYHGAYSPQMMFDDLTIMFADKRDEYMSGTLRDWTLDIGKYTTSVYELLERENNNFLHATIQAHEYLHMSCVARAGYRIAALLNENLK